MRKHRIHVLAMVLVACSTALFSQEADPSKGKTNRIGFMTGYGDQIGFKVPYDYRIVFFQAQYYHALTNKASWNLEVLFQPQYNTTAFRPIEDPSIEITSYEFGLNMGLLIRKNILRDLSLYGFISSGPHYVSEVPQRQAPGFLFSNNFFIGLHIPIWRSLHADIRTGFRHISNTTLALPNGGINNTIFSGGIVKVL